MELTDVSQLTHTILSYNMHYTEFAKVMVFTDDIIWNNNGSSTIVT